MSSSSKQDSEQKLLHVFCVPHSSLLPFSLLLPLNANRARLDAEQFIMYVLFAVIVVLAGSAVAQVSLAEFSDHTTCLGSITKQSNITVGSCTSVANTFDGDITGMIFHCPATDAPPALCSRISFSPRSKQCEGIEVFTNFPCGACVWERLGGKYHQAICDQASEMVRLRLGCDSSCQTCEAVHLLRLNQCVPDAEYGSRKLLMLRSCPPFIEARAWYRGKGCSGGVVHNLSIEQGVCYSPQGWKFSCDTPPPPPTVPPTPPPTSPSYTFSTGSSNSYYCGPPADSNSTLLTPRSSSAASNQLAFSVQCNEFQLCQSSDYSSSTDLILVPKGVANINVKCTVKTFQSDTYPHVSLGNMSLFVAEKDADGTLWPSPFSISCNSSCQSVNYGNMNCTCSGCPDGPASSCAAGVTTFFSLGPLPPVPSGNCTAINGGTCSVSQDFDIPLAVRSKSLFLGNAGWEGGGGLDCQMNEQAGVKGKRDHQPARAEHTRLKDQASLTVECTVTFQG